MNTVTPSTENRYQTLVSLRLAGFPNHRVYRAMSALFDEPGDEDDDYILPLADVWEPDDEPVYEPTPEDLAELAAWSEALELQRERDAELAWCAMADAEHERQRFTERELVYCGLPVG